MAEKNIALIVGSLRKASWNRKIASELIGLAPSSMKLGFIEIGDMPHYNEDLETDSPPITWTDFRAAVRAVDGVIFVTAEYNRTIPGVLKNAIDVGSRPYGSSVWQGKPVAVISSSPGAIGGFGANHVLRQSFVFLGAPALPHEAYINNVHKLFDENGVLAKSTQDFLRKFLTEFETWVRSLGPATS